MSKKLILIIPLLAACDRYSFGDFDFPEPEKPPSLYSVAVEYPEGYNWRLDSLGGQIGADIVCYRDSIEWLRLNSLESGIVGIDADMHRIVDGHLYSDFSNDRGQTVISRDGKELFRYSGRDMICGMEVRDTAIFTLGAHRNGEGWTYRRNGEAIASSEIGNLTSGLYEDNGQLCFSYAEPLPAGDRSIDRHYLVCDGVVSMMLYPPDIDKILAVRRFNGKLHFLATLISAAGVLWQSENMALVIDKSTESGKTGECGFLVAGERLIATARMNGVSYFWSLGSIVSSTASNYTADAVCDNKPYLCYVSSLLGTCRSMRVHYKNREHYIPYRYRLVSPDAFTCDTNEFAIGVNDCEDDHRPVILHGRDTLKFGFNGYFIGLALP